MIENVLGDLSPRRDVLCPFSGGVFLGWRWGVGLSITSVFINGPRLWTFLSTCSDLVIVFNIED